MPDARRHARAPPPPLLATSCFPGLPRCPGRSHAAAPHRSHSPSPSSSPPALSLSHPRTTAVADENHHGHSHPLAPRLCPRAPRRRPRPPHRTTPRRKPCSVDFELFFNLRPPATSSSIRAVQVVPRPTELCFNLAVSSSSVSPPPRSRSRTPAALSPEPIAPRRRPWRCRGQGHPS